MYSTMVPVCPLMSTSNNMTTCLDNCPLNLNGECSIRIIAENLKTINSNPKQSSEPTSDTRE